MIEAARDWIGLSLELVHSYADAERRYQHWLEFAALLPGAEVRVAAWRAPDGTAAYVLSTNHRELTRLRTDWDRPTHELLDDPSLARLRRFRYELRPWRKQYALVSKDKMRFQQSNPEAEYDPSEWDLVPDAWDHDHCSLCWAHICDHPEHGCAEAYVSAEPYGVWVCPPCFQQKLEGWSSLPLDGNAGCGSDLVAHDPPGVIRIQSLANEAEAG